MKKILLILTLFFLIFIPLALAVSIDTDKTDYSRGERVNIEVTDCEPISVLQVKNTVSDLVDMGQGTNDWEMVYNTNSDSSNGKYTLSASCEDGTTQTEYFCVNSPGCTVITPTEDEEEVSAPSPGSGGGRRRCTSQWSCSTWSYCDVSLRQTRNCVDLNRCLPSKEESRSCDKCEESWICSLWSSCRNEMNTRTCSDEHGCGTTSDKPVLQKSCKQKVAPGPKPAKFTKQPPAYMPPPPVPKPKPSFWDNYGLYIIIGAIALVLAAIVVLLIYHFRKPKMAYNYNELREWIKKEKAMGTSHEDIKEILAEHTGWTEEEIANAFKGLAKSKK